MHILVTGGAGFIGSHVVDSLLANGDVVTVLDNFDPFYDRRIKERNIAAHRTHPRWRLIEADVRDADALGRLPAGSFDAIVHLAALGGVRRSIETPLTYQEVNVRGTHNVLEAARRLKVPHFVFASSSSVYGVNPQVPWHEDDSVLKPISPYASTKVSGELLGHVYSHLYGIRFLALRVFTVYGPRQRPDLAIHKFANLIAGGRPVPVYGDGSTRRDYTYVGDLVTGIGAALRYDQSCYEVINVGNNATVTLLEMIRALEGALGMRATIHWQPEQPGDVPQTWASVAKAHDLLGYEPRTPFTEGIRRFAEWFLQTAAPDSRV
ncbi:MAG TPA: GDP-mannose 4,6-dehydratase [Vicinamibacterales bacterium]|nr:GDP-mannose 4,6-dehydratase [Vicinamibacterales bacterium]